MRKVVERERNKTYYRVLHLPIWIWVFFVLPGNLTYQLYLHGPAEIHWLWLAIVFAFCAWRGVAGRLPGVEPRPYVTHYGVDKPNLPYRVVCYTTAWIDLLVPFVLNFLGLMIAVISGRWLLAELYQWLYYPFALLIVLATVLDFTPRARRSTRNEGEERAWFYVAIWTVVPSQIVAWGVWRSGKYLPVTSHELAWMRLLAFSLTASFFFLLSWKGLLGRTARVRMELKQTAAEAG